MDELVQWAHSEALCWAELVFGSFVSQGRELPSEWPCSLEQARLLIAVSAHGQFEASHHEWLVDIIHDRARFLWHEFRSFRAA